MDMEKVLKDAVLCLPIRGEHGDEVLLAKKTRAIGAGLLNGYGGGIEKGETPEMAMLRELEQESGIIAHPNALTKIAVVDFHNTKTDGEMFRCRVHTYVLTGWHGEAEPTEEMIEPAWYPVDALPFDRMMLADKHWMPIALAASAPIYVQAWYGPKRQTLLRTVEISALPKGLL